MRAYVIYVEGHEASEAAAAKAIGSFSKYAGWEPIPFPGMTAETVSQWEAEVGRLFKPKKNSRAAAFLRTEPEVYKTKKACSLNHYILYKHCVTIGEPIAIVEHDVQCAGDWENFPFSEVLIMNIRSALRQWQLNKVLHANRELFIDGPPEGVSPYYLEGLEYHHDKKLNGATIAPGTAAIAVTPAGAKKLVHIYETLGWEQSDFMLNTKHVVMEVIGPELFSWNGDNVSLSRIGKPMNEKPAFSGAVNSDGRRTICEVHREIYDILDTHLRDSEHFPVLVEKLEEVYRMGKKMSAKLRQYKFNYDDDWWETISKQEAKARLADRKKRATT